jgi:hypothetical protein
MNEEEKVTKPRTRRPKAVTPAVEAQPEPLVEATAAPEELKARPVRRRGTAFASLAAALAGPILSDEPEPVPVTVRPGEYTATPAPVAVFPRSLPPKPVIRGRVRPGASSPRAIARNIRRAERGG